MKKEKKFNLKASATLVSTALAGGFVAGSVVAEQNPFAIQELPAGYMQIASGHGAEGKCGEGSCGGSDKKMKGEGKCGEGSCGGSDKKMKGEGKCGEGSCGGSDKKMKGEGKCGEGSCGN